jgi:hypothetical protein
LPGNAGERQAVEANRERPYIVSVTEIDGGCGIRMLKIKANRTWCFNNRRWYAKLEFLRPGQIRFANQYVAHEKA